MTETTALPRIYILTTYTKSINKFCFNLIAIVVYTSLSVSQNDNFFVEKNSDAIRDSINLIKFVNPNEAEKFAFEILEKYPAKKPNRLYAATLAALGLRKINQKVEHKDCKEIRGMIKSIPYLLKVREL